MKIENWPGRENWLKNQSAKYRTAHPLGSTVSQSTFVETRGALADEGQSNDWQVEARKKLDSIDLTLDGYESPEAWLEAARKRCDEIDFEMRSGSSLPETHLLNVSSLNAVVTRSV